MADTVDTTQPVASVPLPSADLINYRFNQTDKALEKLNGKLDNFVSTFESKADAKETHDALQKQIDEIKRNAKWWVGIIMGIAGIAVTVIKMMH